MDGDSLSESSRRAGYGLMVVLIAGFGYAASPDLASWRASRALAEARGRGPSPAEAGRTQGEVGDPRPGPVPGAGPVDSSIPLQAVKPRLREFHSVEVACSGERGTINPPGIAARIRPPRNTPLPARPNSGTPVIAPGQMPLRPTAGSAPPVPRK